MKKFLIYSGALTGITIIFGILFVYGIFDFSEGKSQLIGPVHSASSETDLHNKIVEYTHNIGNLMMEAQTTISVFGDGGDLSIFKQQFEQIKRENDLMDSLMQNTVFEKKQEALQTEYLEKYRPALVSWINGAAEIINAYTPPAQEEPADAGQEPATRQPAPNLPTLKETLNASYNQFIEAHNEYVDELNKSRKY